MTTPDNTNKIEDIFKAFLQEYSNTLNLTRFSTGVREQIIELLRITFKAGRIADSTLMQAIVFTLTEDLQNAYESNEELKANVAKLKEDLEEVHNRNIELESKVDDLDKQNMNLHDALNRKMDDMLREKGL